MTRRRRLRRRLLWAGVLLGLVLLLGAVSVMRVALWARDAIRGAGGTAGTRGKTAAGWSRSEKGEEMQTRTIRRTRSIAIAVLAVVALALPVTAGAGAEQIVIPVDDTDVPWEFDDPCTGETVHGFAHETGQVRVTGLGDQGFHVRLHVNGVADLLDDDNNVVATWTYASS